MATDAPPPTADLVALVREIAAFTAVRDWRDDGYVWCCFCDGDEDSAGVFVHAPDCLWRRARAIAGKE